MLALLGISLFAAGVVSTNPPDISGNWQGDDWGQIKLTQTAPGEYTGTYTDTVAKEKGPGKIDLKWSRIERRYNGTWREGEDDRFGDLSIRAVGPEIRGGVTTDAKSKINPATPRLAELVWTPAEAAIGQRGTPGKDFTVTSLEPVPGMQAALDQGVFLVPSCRYFVLDQEQVRKDIALSPEQWEKLQQISWAYQIERKTALEKQGQSRQALLDSSNRIRRTALDKVPQVLTPDQSAKLAEIAFRRSAAYLLEIPRFRKPMALTSEQEKAYLAILAAMKQENDRIYRDAKDRA